MFAGSQTYLYAGANPHTQPLDGWASTDRICAQAFAGESLADLQLASASHRCKRHGWKKAGP